jgi:peroxiredoxin Q/BCP
MLDAGYSASKEGGCMGNRWWMDTRRSRCAVWVLSSLLLLVGPAWADVELKVGDRAPAFSLRGSDGVLHDLEKTLASGKRGVVLAWFPKAFTPG